MHTAILCFGSNLSKAHAERMIAEGLRLMEASAQTLSASDVYPSSSGYENMVAEMSTCLTYAELHSVTKRAEEALGRTPAMKAEGRVPIDIDIVYFDGEVKRQVDSVSAYFLQGMRMLGSRECVK